MFKKLIFVIAFAAAPLAFASSPLSIEAGDFATQRATIEKDMADGKTYVELSAADRGKVVASLDQIARMLDGAKSSDALAEDKKVDLYNQQEIVNTLLTSASSDSRMVCTREVATGSHRKVTTCLTVAERARRRQKDQDTLGATRQSALQPKN